MCKTVTLTFSDEVYHKLAELAKEQDVSLEVYLTSLAHLRAYPQGPTPEGCYFTNDDFMRHLGMSEEAIARINATPVELEEGDSYDHADA
jgi:hypothetical protein